MSSVIGSAPVGISYSSLSSTSPTSNWIDDTMTAIQNQQNEGGLLGMLDSAGGDGSISSFLSLSANTANALATISQTNVTSAGSLFAQIAATNQQQAAAKKLQESLDKLTSQQVQPTNTLSPFIYLSDGTTIDTVNNIMTMPDGTQYDTTTGAKYVDPTSLVQMGGGAFLNTNTNIITLADGSQIDAVTGLTVTPTT